MQGSTARVHLREKKKRTQILSDPQTSRRVSGHSQVPHLRAAPHQHRPHRRLPPRCGHLRRSGKQIWAPPPQIQVLRRGLHTSPGAVRQAAAGPVDGRASMSHHVAISLFFPHQSQTLR